MNPIKFKESQREKDKIASKENPQLLICLSISRSHKPIRAEVKKKCLKENALESVAFHQSRKEEKAGHLVQGAEKAGNQSIHVRMSMIKIIHTSLN